MSLPPVSIETVTIDESGRLLVRPVEPATFEFIYRAALGVQWAPESRSLVAPVPREWSYFDWFTQICGAVQSEYGQLLFVSDLTRWFNVTEELQASIRNWASSDERRSAETRQEWRTLGFFYDHCVSSRQWRLVSSRFGLLRFRDLLLEHVTDPSVGGESKPTYTGPYPSLEIRTWHQAGIDGHAIYGSMHDIRRLAGIVERELAASSPGARIEIREEYVADAAFSLVLEVREDNFDPASVDPLLKHVG